MNLIKQRKIFYLFSAVLFVISMGAVLIHGLNFGPDFTGDAIIQVQYQDQNVSVDAAEKALVEKGVGVLSASSKDGIISLRTKYLSEEQHQAVLAALKSKGDFVEKGFLSTGPTVGRQLRQNALTALILALAAIIIYIAWAFRQVSKPVSSWIYGVIAVVALLHDVFIPTGVFALFQIPVDSLFITALLTVLGFSVHDTIVVFDRVRENLRKTAGKFEDIVEQSLHETITRSINTSLTTVLSLAAVYFFGGASTKNLALALIVGIIAGTYSSIFIATPLLVTYEKWKGKRS